MKQIPKDILEAIESVKLPSIPNVLIKVLRLIEEDQVSMRELAVLVGRDPSLSVRVLTIANSPIYTLDSDGNFMFINARGETLLGFSKEELIGAPYSKTIHVDDCELAYFALNECKKDNHSIICASSRSTALK